MMSECKKCGAQYDGFMLGRLKKYAKLSLIFELGVFVVLGGYAFVCYYFLDSPLILILSTLVAIALYRVIAPNYHSYCNSCLEKQ